MRNDVNFPPAPGSSPTPPPEPGPVVAPMVPGRTAVTPRSPEATHPHPADRAHSLNQTSDKTATGPLYETPEDRGGIDSTTLSIVVVSGVAVALLIVAYLFYSRL